MNLYINTYLGGTIGMNASSLLQANDCNDYNNDDQDANDNAKGQG